MSENFRRLPAVHRLLESPRLHAAAQRYGRSAATEACRKALESIRNRLRLGGGSLSDAEIEDAVLAELRSLEADAYRPVVNATGVMLHTNLGRSPLPAQQAESLSGYLALEFDVERGCRGQRLAPLKERVAHLFGAEAAVMVNNNASSLLLILRALTHRKEVLVSRSQLIEIGGSFRLPAVMEAAGCTLVEVGCTNRTHLKDYAEAINDETAAILVAHQSNFRIVGFTTNPSMDDLAALAHERELPFIVDQGSGCLHDLTRWGLPYEMTVGDCLTAGADLVCFSGDKLLGGPQAGIIVGRRRWVEPLGRHALYRALRPDKTALVQMDRTLRAHQADRLHEIPLYSMLEMTVDALRRRARRVARRLKDNGVLATPRPTRAALGGGTTPDETLASYGFALDGGQNLLDELRRGETPIVARIEDDMVVVDLRTVMPKQDQVLVAELLSACQRTAGGQSLKTGGK